MQPFCCKQNFNAQYRDICTTNYKTGESEILEVVQSFYAWRGLVVALPVWYPNLSVSVKLLNFVKNVLRHEQFDLSDVNSYLRSV